MKSHVNLSVIFIVLACQFFIEIHIFFVNTVFNSSSNPISVTLINKTHRTYNIHFKTTLMILNIVFMRVKFLYVYFFKTLLTK